MDEKGIGEVRNVNASDSGPCSSVIGRKPKQRSCKSRNVYSVTGGRRCRTAGTPAPPEARGGGVGSNLFASEVFATPKKAPIRFYQPT
ncbi:hypothetical protein GWI33_010341 [Rhynchophorus ferrugineus]|uniref:Uncharacterized protein n=1 Tax=Rhynchophorus ferrugineus TaxID=354439 RepID=A0A834ME22_RHYFE|nr:hypothetical protein GWI33_010341 [Rhynchophorus ferrugineus]